MSSKEVGQAVAALLEQVRAIQARGIDRESLPEIVSLLEKLAERRDFFNFASFPPPAAAASEGKTAIRYRLNDDGDDSPTLYLNSLLPGKQTPPHNHETWAIIVAVEGTEFNRVYLRTDDGSDPEFATLQLEREITVQPGAPIAFLGDDIHDIRVEGERPTLHFHLYGRPLEALSGRFAVQPDGRLKNYNRNHMEPSAAVVYA
ncbi:cysteine dioxygenase family protein [Azomonas macrocytogenes]|uniref:Putative metal-dependent enzyme (Double-stranded beta helix superfamily) n=1 Tax=Azomonas macrocytogenes TaxID=69962 RepID=A0A839T5X1_AZOMA|nr:cysteine dioxygenase family protein [Azomonas macrocytogenes]MBB3103335.1 putative metal-dependent enzyme (double-stranded beta helix superfamily) [Azomonas macrocytogenes]